MTAAVRPHLAWQRRPIEERFAEKCEHIIGTGCVLWRGAHGGRDKYGSVYVDGRYVRAHVYAWGRIHGLVPEGFELDHLCSTQNCVTEAHLEPVTHAENMRRQRARLGRLEALR